MLRRLLCCLLGHNLVVERRVPGACWPMFAAWCATCKRLCIVHPEGTPDLPEPYAQPLDEQLRAAYERLLPGSAEVLERVEHLGKVGETDG